MIIFMIFILNNAQSNYVNDSDYVILDTCYVTVIANRTGDLWIEMKCPIRDNTYTYDFCCPYFKYEMPFLYNVHDPFSQYGKEIEIEIYDYYLISNLGKKKFLKSVNLYQLFGGDQVIKSRIPNSLILDDYRYVVVQFNAKKYITIDPFFYDFTYAIFNTFNMKMIFKITVTSHFTYSKLNYRVVCNKYDINYGRIDKICGYNKTIVGEKVQISLIDSLRSQEHIDIHLTASNLAVNISRHNFWKIAVYLVICLFLLPLLKITYEVTKLGFKMIKMFRRNKNFHRNVRKCYKVITKILMTKKR